jgi:hypothetical protein
MGMGGMGSGKEFMASVCHYCPLCRYGKKNPPTPLSFGAVSLLESGEGKIPGKKRGTQSEVKRI